MNIKQHLQHSIGLRNPLRRIYHWLAGCFAFVLSGNPARDMYVIGITGTKGKTTTATLIASALEASGKKVALLSTAQIWIAGEKNENHSKMTMDNPFHLWKTIKKARKMSVTHLVLETSSHGIYYFRNFGIRYQSATLTNISQDHLDLHGTMEHYARTKAKMFSGFGKICILPQDCEYRDIFEQISHNFVTYGFGEGATYRGEMIPSPSGIEMNIRKGTGAQTISSPLVGVFNAENLLAAYVTLVSIGIDVDIIRATCTQFSGAPGRMESLPNILGMTIIIDYAHTENSLRSVLETLKKDQRIILVFGATGDRDTTKRPKMGAVADALADIIVLTDDDTYSEPSAQIIEMVRSGISRSEGDNFAIIPDRKAAILWALSHAQGGDIVLIAGKGCETAQITNVGPIPWSDRGIVEEFLMKNSPLLQKDEA